jgi:hypothetical protein
VAKFRKQFVERLARWRVALVLRAEPPPQRFGDLIHGVPAFLGDSPIIQESMDHPLVASALGGNACRSETVGILLALVSEEVVLRGNDERRGDLGEVRGPQRGHPIVLTLTRGSEVSIPHPWHEGSFESKPRGIFRIRGGVRIVCSDGADQHLADELRPSSILREHGHHGGHVPTGAIPADGHVAGIEIEALLDLRIVEPAQHLITIFDRDRESLLRRTTIVDSYNNGPRTSGELAAQGVVGLQISEDPTSTVKVHEDRTRGRRSFRKVESNPYAVTGSRHGMIFDPRNRTRRSCESVCFFRHRSDDGTALADGDSG